MTKRRVLLTGATGAIGGLLVEPLLAAGHDLRALVRDPERARAALPDDVALAVGDVFAERGLGEALRGVDVAYYLVHAMGRGNARDFAAADRRGARAFASAARAAGVQRVVYLGAMTAPGGPSSHHMRSRAEVAVELTTHGPETIHAKAAMVISERSSSFQILHRLVERLPVMVLPTWVNTDSQPIAERDVIAALERLAVREDLPPEVELGGADVLSYREMMGRYARIAGLRGRPGLPVPVVTPRLSALWVSLVSQQEYALVRPLVDGLREETRVTHPPPAGVNDAPMGFDDAVREALAGRRGATAAGGRP